MKVLIAGIDGYIGFSLAQNLLVNGHEILGVDCFHRRRMVKERGLTSIIPIVRWSTREKELKKLGKFHRFIALNIAESYEVPRLLGNLFKQYKPEAIVNLAQQPSASYSMIDQEHANFTLRNNVQGMLNLLWAMRDYTPEAHLITLATLGEYGFPNINIPEGFFEIEYEGMIDILPFPRQTGSVYHSSKAMATNLAWFASRIWELRVTDIHQGIVYGTRTETMGDNIKLKTRFDVGESFGTMLNRAVACAIMNHPIVPYGCYDEKTEILTKNGWKKIKDVNLDDLIATLNDRDEIEYHRPTEKQEYDYDGILIHFGGFNSSYDLLVTPDHRMYVRQHMNKNGWCFKSAQELENISGYELKKNANWQGKKFEIFEIPEEFTRKKGPKSQTKFQIEPFLRFLGWYLSEGSTRGGSIKISQTKKKNRDEILMVVKSMGIDPKPIEEAIIVHCRPLARYLKQFGTAKNKFVPKWVKELNSDLLKIFLLSIIKGDGSDKPTLFSYFTSSKKLSDDIQEVAMKCGFSASIHTRTRKIKPTGLNYAKKEYEYTEYTVNISKRNHTPLISKKPQRQYYQGKIYDVTVPNHIILVRRNGKPTWSSNSGMQTRGYIALQDSVKCLTLAVENRPTDNDSIHGYRVLNQYDKCYSCNGVADIVKKVGNEKFDLNIEVKHISNPRIEPEVHYYNVHHDKLYKMGWKPTRTLEEELVTMFEDLMPYKERLLRYKNKILPTIRWRPNHVAIKK